MKMKKITSAALALGLALGLAGCGGNQAAGGSDLEYIKEKGTMGHRLHGVRADELHRRKRRVHRL